MPSFLNKVFGRKTNDDKDRAKPAQTTDSDLLDGKYEAVIPLNLPSNITAFSKAQTDRDHSPFSLFRPKSIVGSPLSKGSEALPQLSLHLPVLKDNAQSLELGVFEVDPESQRIFDDSVIGARLLTPFEALILVRACAQTITERGLETLGIMHPHWHSASPNIQRKLISLFIHSLAPNSRTTTLPSSPHPAMSAFEAELEYTRSPHDVAAVLRWGLRHLVLQDNAFGKDPSAPQWAWYKSFFHAEKEAAYPSKSFTELLVPQLPQPHIDLLLATIDIISALASHAEANSISGSKLSKFLGLWLLTTTRADPSDNWDTFYARWDRAGRILEHLFLSRIREESFHSRLPTRLQELVKHYPYSKGSPNDDEDLLPHPRFSTRRCDVLFVRIETLLSDSGSQPKISPIQLLLDAFNLSSEAETFDHIDLWNALKTAATETASSSSEPSPREGPQFGRVFVDDTIKLLASIAPDSLLMSPMLEVSSPVPRRSSPFSKILERTKGKSTKDNGAMSPTSVPSSPIVNDWAQFSSSGFGEPSVVIPLASTLLDADKDIEITESLVSPKSSKKWVKSRSRQRSADSPRETSTKEPAILGTKLASVHVAQVDEAFIDFWSDAIADPITANWPSFIICGLKPLPADESINWLVIEQTYVHQQRSQTRATSPERRGTSPRPSFRSDISGTIAATRKRFSFFGGGSKSSLTGRKGSSGKSPQMGELGQILPEEEERPDTPVGVGLDVAAAAASAAVVGAAVAEPEVSQLLLQDAVPGPKDVVQTADEEANLFTAANEAPSPQVSALSDDFVPEPAPAEEEVVAASPAAASAEELEVMPEAAETLDVPPVDDVLLAAPAEEPEVVPEAPETCDELPLDDALLADPVAEASPDLPVALVDEAPSEVPADEIEILEEDDITIEVEEAEPVDESEVEESEPVDESEVEESEPVDESEAEDDATIQVEEDETTGAEEDAYASGTDEAAQSDDATMGYSDEDEVAEPDVAEEFPGQPDEDEAEDRADDQ